jgi:antibiotic biosynthesis monooxygenase (ABM) superfamily enzyme
VKEPFRDGTWRRAIITYAAVLPLSLFLNFVFSHVTGHWPKLQLVVFNAAVLVAALNWALLPMLHWATRGWAVRAPLVDATLGNHTPRRQGIIDVSAHQ